VVGVLRKMSVTLSIPVSYQLNVGSHTISLNNYLGRQVILHFCGRIYCIQCGRKISKSFQQGYCFPCMRQLNECGNCIIFPERCLVEQGRCPADHWAHHQCYGPQLIYLANSSGLKVGVTRLGNLPFRWIDQGALQAIPLLQASNRYRAGLMEVALKNFVSDRTNWRAMLKNDVVLLDMVFERQRLLKEAAAEIDEVMRQSPQSSFRLLEDPKPVEIQYPVLAYPGKVKALSFDQSPDFQGKLLGIKGQYLILDSGVLNVRKFGGYEVQFRHP